MNEIADDKVIVKFLGKDLIINKSDKNFQFLFFLSELDYKQVTMKNGLYHLNKFKNDYGVRICDKETEKQIIKILTDNGGK